MDRDKDGTCDRIQKHGGSLSTAPEKNGKKETPPEKKKASTPKEAKAKEKISPENSTSGKRDSVKDMEKQKTENVTASGEKKESSKKTYAGKPYRLPHISLILVFLYLISHFCQKRKIISHRSHLRFWNLLLLASFLVSCGLGILLVLMINYGFIVRLPFNIMLWHVEAGIAMTVIVLFHIHWHWKYVKNMFKLPERPLS